MQEWFLEEWLIVSKALKAAQATGMFIMHAVIIVLRIGNIDNNSGLSYQLQLHHQYLLWLCTTWQSHTWQSHTSSLNTGNNELEPWGPTDEEILNARIESVQSLVAGHGEELDSDDDLDVEEDSWSDDGLVEALETLDLANGFKNNLADCDTHD